MSGFYVLDVPEFAPILAAARLWPTCRLRELRAGYTFVEFDSEFEIKRQDTGLAEAVWFGCLTGGLDGRVLNFDAVSLKLGPSVTGDGG